MIDLHRVSRQRRLHGAGGFLNPMIGLGAQG
jgi:hypothetical protein